MTAVVTGSLVFYMKQLFLITVFMLGLGCKAQTPIYSLSDKGYGFNQTPGVYYKDSHADFNKFVGTWKYTNGNTSFIIILQKKTMYYDAEENLYTDLLIGQYKYTDSNGIEVVNTLPNLDMNNPFNNNIFGLLLYPDTSVSTSKLVKLNFKDPERDYLNRSIFIKHIVVDGSSPEKIEIQWIGSMSILPNENSPAQIRVPEQNYILTKQ